MSKSIAYRMDMDGGGWTNEKRRRRWRKKKKKKEEGKKKKSQLGGMRRFEKRLEMGMEEGRG